MFGAGITETVVRVRPPETDNTGDPVPGTGSELSIEGCLYAPGPVLERNDHAAQVGEDGTVYAPEGVDVEATDRLIIRGVVYEVDGHPQWWRGAGVVIGVKRVTG